MMGECAIEDKRVLTKSKNLATMKRQKLEGQQLTRWRTMERRKEKEKEKERGSERLKYLRATAFRCSLGESWV